MERQDSTPVDATVVTVPNLLPTTEEPSPSHSPLPEERVLIGRSNRLQDQIPAPLEDLSPKEWEDLPLTNASLALAEFTSILRPSDPQQLREHLIHLIKKIDKEDLLIQLTKRVEEEGFDNSMGSRSNVTVSDMTSSAQAASTLAPEESSASRRYSDRWAQSTRTNQTHTDTSIGSDSTSNIMALHGGVSFMGNAVSRAIQQDRSDQASSSSIATAFAVDPLELEEPLPTAGREGRRVAVSAAPISFATLQSLKSSLRAEKTASEARQLLRLVRNSHVFSRMEDAEIDGIVQAMKREEYQAGEDILVQGGEPKEKLFILSEGACEVIKNGRSVSTIHVGATFGELEMMYKQATNAATVRCVTNCTTYTLDEAHYHHAVMNDSLQKRKRYVDVVQKVPFLRCLPEYERMKIAEALQCKSYKRGQSIIKFGQRGDLMHCIMRGTVKVVGRNNGKRVEVVRLGENDVVGELEFLFNHLTVADVIATSKRVVTACITRKHFELIAGPIQERLKEFVATSPTYENYYINEVANASVRSELSKMGSSRRTRRIASGDSDGMSRAFFGDVEAGGEIILTVPPGLSEFVPEFSNVEVDSNGMIVPPSPAEKSKVDPTDNKTRVFRYPLTAIAKTVRTIVVGLREDGLITAWNHSLESLLSYSASEVVGQNIYSFLLNEKEQKQMYHAVVNARSYAGNVDDFMNDVGLQPKKYTLARSDGLTRATVELSVVPPLVSAGEDCPEVLMVFGTEVKSGPQNVIDQPQLLSGQIQAILTNSEVDSDTRLMMVAEVLRTFEETYRALTVSTERLRVMNIRQLIGQVIMDFGGECVQKGLAVRQRFEGLTSEKAYLDAELLPECLRYVMNMCLGIEHSTTVTITVTLTEKNGLEFLIINFNVDGQGFPVEFEAVCDRPLNDGDSDISSSRSNVTVTHTQQFRRARAAVEKQGGTIKVQSIPGDSNLVFLLPFMRAYDGEEENATVEEALPNHLVSETTTSCSTSRANVFAYAPDSVEANLEGPTKSETEDVQELTLTTTEQTAYNFTTLVAEDTAAHRNMLCSYLWERKHAVLPARSLADVQRLAGVADILIIDLQQSIMNSLDVSTDPISYLREMSSQMAIVISAKSFDLVSAETYQKAGFITLRKPCTPVQAMQAIRLAEEKIAQVKQEAEKIAQTRALLSKNSRGAWQRGKLLGKGSFGEVFEAIDVLTGGKMAVKEMRLGRGSEKLEKVEKFVEEISTMCNLQHPNIIHYFYCEENQEENVIRVFMEYAAGGTLQNLLSKNGAKLDFKRFQKLLHEVTLGLAYIHSQNYVHCDIKTANVLLGHDGMAKIGDFGTARTLKPGQLLYEMQGSPLYMSPECMAAGEIDEDGNKIGFSFPTDIWSLGCVALEMITNAPPFAHVKQVKGPAGLTQYITSLNDVPDLSVLFDEPPSVIEFVAACLNPDVTKRATAQELLQFSIFNEAADEQTKSALQALKRAQLLYVLNQFVAFQEPEDRERSRTVSRRKTRDFFDSSSNEGEESDDDDDDDDDEGFFKVKVNRREDSHLTTPSRAHSSPERSPKRRVKGIPTSSSDDEPGIVIPTEDASPTPKKRSKTVAPEDSQGQDTGVAGERQKGVKSLSSPSDDGVERDFFDSSDDDNGVGPQTSNSVLPNPNVVAESSAGTNRSFSRHFTGSNHPMTALVGTNKSFAAPNASFFNFSFNKNISFMGGNLDDVLNSAANDFLSGLGGPSGKSHTPIGEDRGVESVSPSRPASRRSSRSPSARSPDQTPLHPKAEVSSSVHEDSGSGLRAISRQELARPGVVNRSFFMVEDLQLPLMNTAASGKIQSYLGGTQTTISADVLPRDAAGRRAAIRYDVGNGSPVLTEETLQKHQELIATHNGESEHTSETPGQHSSRFQSVSSEKSAESPLFRIGEELQEIARGLQSILQPRNTTAATATAVSPKHSGSLSPASSASVGRDVTGGNPLSNGAGDAPPDSQKTTPLLVPGRPPTVPTVLGVADSNLPRLRNLLTHIQSLSTYAKEQLRQREEHSDPLSEHSTHEDPNSNANSTVETNDTAVKRMLNLIAGLDRGGTGAGGGSDKAK